MAPHRATQQHNRRDVPEGLKSGDINVCRTMAIRTTLTPYSRHGFTLVSRSFNSGLGTGVVATVGPPWVEDSNQFGEIIRFAQRCRGGREPMQPSLREDQNRLGRTRLQYSLRQQSQARLFTGVRDLKLQNRGSFFVPLNLAYMIREVQEALYARVVACRRESEGWQEIQRSRICCAR